MVRRNEMLEQIYNKVKEVTGIDVRIKGRQRERVYARKIFCTIARNNGFTFHSIANHIGINHATVLWHCKDTPYLLKQDIEFNNNYLKVNGEPTEEKLFTVSDMVSFAGSLNGLDMDQEDLNNYLKECCL